MGRQQRQPDRLAGRLLQQVAHQQHVAQRLGHLGVVHIHEAVVQPVAHEQLAAMGAGALGHLVLVMGKDQVVAAAVDVDGAARDAGRPSPSIRYASRAGPGPTGLSQPGRSGVDGFHSTKSPASSL